MISRHFRCKACNEVIAERDMLSAPNPFDESDMLTGCPRCLACDYGFALICDHDGCRADASCGWPTAGGGYRQTCHQHSPWATRAPSECEQ